MLPLQYLGSWKTNTNTQYEVLADVKAEARELGDLPLFKIDSHHVKQYLQPHSLQEVSLCAQQELVMNEEWALDEDLLTAEEAQNWMVKRKTPSLEGRLELFQHASALDKCAIELTVEATKLWNQAETACKAGLKLMIGASKPSVMATVTASSSTLPTGSMENPIDVKDSSASNSPGPTEPSSK